MSKDLSKFKQIVSVSSVLVILLRVRSALNPLATLQLSTCKEKGDVLPERNHLLVQLMKLSSLNMTLAPRILE